MVNLISRGRALGDLIARRILRYRSEVTVEIFRFALLRTPDHIYPHWNLVLNGHRQQRRWVDLEIRESSRNCPRNLSLTALLFHFKWNVFVLRGLAGELNLQISINSCRAGGRFWQAGAYRDYRKLRAAGNLKHMKVAVAVPRIE